MNETLPEKTEPTPRRGSDRSRIVVACLALLFVAAGALWLRKAWSGRRDPGRAAVRDEIVRPGDAGAAGDASESAAPSRPIDPRSLADVRDGSVAERLVREPAAFDLLLNEALRLHSGDFAARGEVADARRLQSDPGSARGAPIAVRGTVESIESPGAGAATEPGRRDFRGVLTDPSGARFMFSVLELPSGQDDPGALVGRTARFEGFFFKLFARESAPGRYDDSLVYVVGRELVPTYPAMERNEDIGRIPFMTGRDRTPAQMIEWPDSLVYATLNWVRSLGTARLRELPVTDVDWTELRREPDHYRGRLVRVVGPYEPELQWLRRLGEGGVNPLGVVDFHEGLLKLSADHRFRWIGFDAPGPAHDGGGDAGPRALVLEGVFIKNVAWLNARNDLVSGPLIVATRLESRPIAGAESIATVAITIVGLTAVCLVLCLVGIHADGQKARQFQSEFLARRRSRIARGAAARPSRETPL